MLTPFLLLSPSVWAGPNDSCPMNRTVMGCHPCRYVTEVSRLSLPRWFWWSKLPGPHGTEPRPDSFQKASKKLGGTSTQQPMKNLKAVNKLWPRKWICPQFSFEMRPRPRPTLCSPRPVRKHRTLLGMPGFPTQRNHETINMEFSVAKFWGDKLCENR